MTPARTESCLNSLGKGYFLDITKRILYNLLGGLLRPEHRAPGRRGPVPQDPRKGKEAAQISEMVFAWAPVAEKYLAGELGKDEYDRWRDNDPQYDDTQIWDRESCKWENFLFLK